MIETRLLQQFIAVAEELHFHRAAARLNMAQPPLSQAIRRLEQEIGHQLFERTNRSVQLTPAGSDFLITARTLLAMLQEGVERTRRVAQGVDGHLRISFLDLSPYPLVLQALRQFRQAAPQVAFTLSEATTFEQVQGLEAATVDLGFLRAPGRTTPWLRLEKILREPIVIALPADHPLATEARVDLSRLADEDFVASPRSLGQGFHDQLVALCRYAGFVPCVAQQARHLQTLAGLVASGFGVALLPASLATSDRHDLVFRALQVDAPEALQHLDLYMAWNDSVNVPVRDRLIEAVRLAISETS